MSRVRILFVPCYFGLPSHFVPLLKLYQRLPANKYEAAFFLPRMSRAEVEAQIAGGFNPEAAYYYGDAFLTRFDIPILDLEQRYGVINELAAYTKFSPDLVIDDSSFTTALARQIQRRPRLTIARTGIFGDRSSCAHYPHSLDPMVGRLRVPPRLRLELPGSLDGYFDAEAYVIPGSATLEQLPGLPSKERAFYSGPLMLDEEEERLFHSERLAEFVDANRGRRIAYVTLGVDASKNPHAKVLEALQCLLRRDFAVITNMRFGRRLTDSRGSASSSRCFHARRLPMHYVSSNADLIVHVAGSATYHYPILHGKPAITVGTRCRDREQIARTLNACGFSQHIPAPAEGDGFLAAFVDALDRFEAGRFPFDPSLAERLSAQRREIEATAAGFDADAAIEAALSAERPSRTTR